MYNQTRQPRTSSSSDPTTPPSTSPVTSKLMMRPFGGQPQPQAQTQPRPQSEAEYPRMDSYQQGQQGQRQGQVQVQMQNGKDGRQRPRISTQKTGSTSGFNDEREPRQSSEVLREEGGGGPAEIKKDKRKSFFGIKFGGAAGGKEVSPLDFRFEFMSAFVGMFREPCTPCGCIAV